MKHVDRVFIQDVVQNFKQITVAIKTDEKILIRLAGHNMVITGAVKSMANIGFAHSVPEGCGLENNVFVHI
jgi:hypothetical protein